MNGHRGGRFQLVIFALDDHRKAAFVWFVPKNVDSFVSRRRVGLHSSLRRMYRCANNNRSEDLAESGKRSVKLELGSRITQEKNSFGNLQKVFSFRQAGRGLVTISDKTL
jgi:hypothetical protein